MVCDRINECEGWKKHSNLYIHGGIIKINGLHFKFCPWCGKEIKWDVLERTRLNKDE